eukprot:2635619-Amphidinium_carterae.1
MIHHKEYPSFQHFHRRLRVRFIPPGLPQPVETTPEPTLPTTEVATETTANQEQTTTQPQPPPQQQVRRRLTTKTTLAKNDC